MEDSVQVNEVVTHETPIMKLTMFMTPGQWNRIEDMKVRGSGEGQWLHKEQEVTTYDEYMQCLLDHHQIQRHLHAIADSRRLQTLHAEADSLALKNSASKGLAETDDTDDTVVS